jgi:hypothetical protein
MPATNTDITPTGFLGHNGTIPGTMTLAEARALLALTTADLSDAGELAASDFTGLYSTGAGVPSASARFVGEFYINTTPNPDTVYQALGPAIGAGAADWTLITNLATGNNGEILGITGGAEAWRTAAQVRSDIAVDTVSSFVEWAPVEATAQVLVLRNTIIGTITSIDAETDTGSLTLAVKIADDDQANPTNITGLSAVAVTATVANTAASAANTMAKSGTTDRVLTATPSSLTSSPTKCRLQINGTRS